MSDANTELNVKVEIEHLITKRDGRQFIYTDDDTPLREVHNSAARTKLLVMRQRWRLFATMFGRLFNRKEASNGYGHRSHNGGQELDS